MKNTLFTIIFLVFTTLACKAQQPIIPLDDREDYIPNAYYKDIDNDLNKFTGTWVYTNGLTSLTITLQKIEQASFSDCFFDTLVGEYKYIENNIVIVNTLPDLNDPSIEPYYHNIAGSRILYEAEYPGCDDCEFLEKRVRLYFDDPDHTRQHLSSYLAIRYVNDNGVEKIEAQLVKLGTTVIPEGAPTEPRVPYGDYTFTKL
ncbi:hypothetical protein BFP78_01140 [Gaetbulibacter sp. 5U11]|nr:hypothetical protein BFP78_01140 [Gaetbulibacter sp. 5U11]